MAQQTDAYTSALSANKAWASHRTDQDPAFFQKHADGQSPSILWLGCADSRVPETTILGLQPGDVFVHRNIANIVSPTDINTAAVVEYAVTKLQVQHIILCGHSCCGGALASLSDQPVGGILDTWLAPLRMLRVQHQSLLAAIESEPARILKMAELNVAAGVVALMSNWTVQNAIMERGLQVHGCIYDIETGTIREL